MNTDAPRRSLKLRSFILFNIKSNANIEIVTDHKTSGGAVMLRPIRIQCAVGWFSAELPIYRLHILWLTTSIFTTFAKFDFRRNFRVVTILKGGRVFRECFHLITDNSTIPLHVVWRRKRTWLNCSTTPAFVWMDWGKPTETVWLAGLRAEFWTLNFSRKQETIRHAFDAVVASLVYYKVDFRCRQNPLRRTAALSGPEARWFGNRVDVHHQERRCWSFMYM